MKVLLCFIGTQNYFYFFDKYYQTFNTLFLPNTKKDFLILTDLNYVSSYNNQFVLNIEHKQWPYVTLLRFKNILKAEELIKKYDWFIFIDADMYANKVITEQDFFVSSKRFFGVQHPLFLNSRGTFENNIKSCAYVSEYDDMCTYWQGCFWGGQNPYILNMIEELNNRVDLDLNNGIVAKWHDESHLNKFYIENKRFVHTYDSSYCYPEIFINGYMNLPVDKKIIHIEKSYINFPRFSGVK
jgi:hypothetical protein